ncbi:hypothetical protein AVEN_99888-1 [Araneus ventricosus]|uniref:Uncharacterized protein n=1 Tax=Araneus ventricosus TaxID=182803 RepID=A0A4Y2QDP5_ARAVE|nr:hypothetical protein AVEN_99888-1 [Araneus ventricosus]
MTHPAVMKRKINLNASRGRKRMRLLTDSEDDSEESNERQNIEIAIDGSGNQSIGQYLSVHKDSFSHRPTNRRLEEAVVGDWPKMMKFKAL